MPGSTERERRERGERAERAEETKTFQPSPTQPSPCLAHTVVGWRVEGGVDVEWCALLLLYYLMYYGPYTTALFRSPGYLPDTVCSIRTLGLVGAVDWFHRLMN